MIINDLQTTHYRLPLSSTMTGDGASSKLLIEQAIKPLLIGTSARKIEKPWDEMWWKMHYIGRGGLVSFAMSAVDITLWDLVGKIDRVPWWQLLGGHSNSATPYAGGIDLHLSQSTCSHGPDFMYSTS